MYFNLLFLAHGPPQADTDASIAKTCRELVEKWGESLLKGDFKDILIRVEQEHERWAKQIQHHGKHTLL